MNTAQRDIDAQQSLNRQAQLLKLMTDLPVSDAIGAACSFLLHCAYHHQAVFRRVLREPVVREGFRGVSLIKVFTRLSH